VIDTLAMISHAFHFYNTFLSEDPLDKVLDSLSISKSFGFEYLIAEEVQRSQY